jgi:hypothetical protein
MLAMKTTLLLAIAAIASCCPKVFPAGPNPLDRPQDFKSAATLHEENVQAITSNPGYRLP